MACLGVHFALTADDERRLLDAAGSGDDAVMDALEAIEEAWDADWLVQTDKAWDAIHRCLTDGTLTSDVPPPLHLAVLGGRQLYDGDDYFLAHVTPEEVKEVADALGPIDREWFRRKYDAIDPEDYDADLGDEDFEYTWENFEDLRAFFRKAADAGRAVIFTADQ